MEMINIVEFGAEKDSFHLQTYSIQRAIDAASECGGEVIIPEGNFRTGSLLLRSGVTLHLRSGARLVGSDCCEDYQNYHIPTTLGYVDNPVWVKKWHLPDHYTNALITIADAENVSIIGDENSIIDGSNCFDGKGEEGFRGPMCIRVTRGKNIKLSGYHIIDSANWAHQIDGSSDVFIRNITVSGGHDGLDFHHCSNCEVADSVFETGDDCIAGYDNENIQVINCTFNTSCNSFRFGCKKLNVEHCSFVGHGKFPHRISGRHNTLYAFEYYAHAADTCRDSTDWSIRNCTFDGVDALMHYDYPNEYSLQMAAPLRDVTFIDCHFSNILKRSVFKDKTNCGASKINFVNCTFDGCVEPFMR